MKINLIIATYGAIPEKHSNNNLKKDYLKINLQCLNHVKTNIDKITIMKPKINKQDKLISNYYDFSNLDLSNIRNKIQIIQCDNIGISYGQFFSAMLHSGNEYFDYHLWLEDDYIISSDYIENTLINLLQKNLESSNIHLCPFIYKNKKWDILSYARFINETPDNINKIKEKLSCYDAETLSCRIPDMMQGGIFSRNIVQKIKLRFGSFENVINFFDIPLTKIWIHQILFGYVLKLSGVEIQDTANQFMNMFYETSIDKIFLCNFPENVNTWKEKSYQNELFAIPYVLPIESLVYYDKHKEDIDLMLKYTSSTDSFYKPFWKYKKIAESCINKLNSQLILRELEPLDFYKGYIELMYEFTNFKYDVSQEDFNSYITDCKDNRKIYVVYSKQDTRIVGAGAIFCLKKLHNNPVGQIEDFIVSKKYRNQGVGRMILKKLIQVSQEEFGCYKTILMSNQDNFDFYEKVGFEAAGVQMKYSS